VSLAPGLRYELLARRYQGAVRMGIEHGVYCLGCCWLLFVILFPLGMLNIAALAALTLLITRSVMPSRVTSGCERSLPPPSLGSGSITAPVSRAVRVSGPSQPSRHPHPEHLRGSSVAWRLGELIVGPHG
jgi:predicted metal-binding integral membrane protein DUF2182